MRSRIERHLEALLIGVSFSAFTWYCDAQQFSLAIRPAAPGIELSWPATVNLPQLGPVFPEYEVQQSADLIHWEPIGGKVRGISGQSGPMLNMTLNTKAGAYFYRLGASLFSQTGIGGAEVFGYGTQL